MTIRDCMSTDVRLTSPQDTIREAARTMKDADTGALPVGENDRLVGMVTDRDIAVRAVAEGKGIETPIREVTSGDLEVRRLPVLNRDKRLVGMISLGDLAKNGNGSQGAAALSGLSQPGGPYKHA